MAPTTDPILDLTTERDRPTVRIDAVDYLLRTFNDLTLADYKTLERRLLPRIAALLLLDTLTTEQGQELSALLEQTCRLALAAPEAVQVALGDVDRLRVFQVFTQLLTPSLRLALRAAAPVPPSTGPTSSRGSNGSTAARSTTGARTRRSATSGRA